MSLKKQLLSNGIAATLQKGVRVLQQLVLVPFFINAWGAEYYGEWLTLTIIPSILAFSDLGFGTAASNMLVLRHTSGDVEGASDMAKAGFWIITLLVISAVILSCIILYVVYKLNLFNDLVVNSNEAMIAVFLMMSSRLINFYTQFYDGFFRAVRKAHVSIHLNNIYTFLSVILGICVLLLGGFIVEYAIVTFILAVIYVPSYIIIAKKKLNFKNLKYSSKVNRVDIKKAFRTGIGFLMSPLWQSIYFQGTTFVVRVILGPGPVAIFNTVRTLSRSINQFYSIVNASIFPELQYEIGRGNFEKSRKLFRISILFTVVTAFLGMMLLYYFGMWFYDLWTNSSLNPPVLMWNLFIVGIGFNALWWTAGVIFRAINRPYYFSVAGVIASIISVGFTFLFTTKYGLIGAAIGSISLDILLALYILPVSCRLLEVNLGSLLKDSYKDLLEVIKRTI